MLESGEMEISECSRSMDPKSLSDEESGLLKEQEESCDETEEAPVIPSSFSIFGMDNADQLQELSL